jgi:hypothetical protein
MNVNKQLDINSLKVQSLRDEIEIMEKILYPKFRENENSPLELTIDEWFGVDANLSENEIAILQVKLNILKLFSGLYWELIERTNENETFDWFNLVTSTYQMNLYGNTEIIEIVNRLKTKSPENWMNLFK